MFTRTYVSGEKLLVVAGLILLAAGCSPERGVTLPTGTKLVISPNITLSTQHSIQGTRFTATVLDAVEVDGTAVLPAGTQVHGVLTEVWCPDRTPGPGRLTVAVTAVEGGGGELYPLTVDPVSIESADADRPDLERLAAEAVPGVALEQFGRGPEGDARGRMVRLITKGNHVALEPGRHLVVFTAAPADLPAAVWASRD